MGGAANGTTGGAGGSCRTAGAAASEGSCGGGAPGSGSPATGRSGYFARCASVSSRVRNEFMNVTGRGTFSLVRAVST